MAARFLLVITCTLGAALGAAAPTMAIYEAPAPTTPAAAYVPGQIVVVWEDDASHSEMLAAKRNAEVDSAVTLGDPSFQAVEVEPGQSTFEALAELESDPAVALAIRDAMLSATSVPNDPLFPQQWALQNSGAGVAGFVGAAAGADIDATDAWDQTIGTPGSVVADIDSGYRFEGPDLGPVVWTNAGEVPGDGIDNEGDGKVDDVHGYDFVGANAESPSEDADPTDNNLISGGHGVHTAGTIGAAGNNAAGVTGVAQDARIMPLRVCANSPNSNPANALACPTSSIIAAINFAGAHDVPVANISLTTTVKASGEAMREALAKNPGTLYVIAAGNDGQDNELKPHYPCNAEPVSSGIPGAVDNVVCVAATNQADGLASFSDFGKTSVDLGAPGTEILSTYPVEDLLLEDSEMTNFPLRWTAGSEGGFGRTNESPLTSFGISDTPEEAPVADSTRESTLTVPFQIPSGYGNCQLSGRRFVALGGGRFTQEVIVVGVKTIVFEPQSTSGSAMVNFSTAAITGLAGTEVQLRFRYEVGSAPAINSGVWLDDLQFACYQAPTAPPSYAFLQGTSMAAPQVSGTAALIFSLHPEASVTAVRNALLESVEPVASLAGKTVTEGRLDALQAMIELDATPPAGPTLTTDPPSPSTSSTPRIVGSAEPGSTVRVYPNASCAGAPLSQLSAAALASSGVPVAVPSGTTLAFSATATDPALNESVCAAVSYTNVSSLSGGTTATLIDPPTEASLCTVPKLTGKTLVKAKAAILRASCKVGRVTKPKRRPGQRPSPLVVKSSSPAVGTNPANGVVALKLGPKPRARHKRRS